MGKRFQAVYTNGMLQPLEVLALEEKQQVTVTITDPLGQDVTFFAGKTLNTLASEQTVKPLQTISTLAGGISDDEDIDAFVNEIYSART
jgi:predicted DNA-binding antitoxin AbrB/MazE fold protein